MSSRQGYRQGNGFWMLPLIGGLGCLLIFAFISSDPMPSVVDVFKGPVWRSPSTMSAVTLTSNKWLRVEQHTVRLPDGRIERDWRWVDLPGMINVLIRHRDGTYLVMNHTKYGFTGYSLAVVGGIMDQLANGEVDPAKTAAREVEEETGLICQTYVPLGKYITDANRGCGVFSPFLAKDCAEKARGVDEGYAVKGADLEAHQILRMSRSELSKGLLNGAFKELKWATTVSMALLVDPE